MIYLDYTSVFGGESGDEDGETISPLLYRAFARAILDAGFDKVNIKWLNGTPTEEEEELISGGVASVAAALAE